MLRFIGLLAFAAMSAGCVPIYVHTDLNPAFASASYRTVAWGAEPPLLAAPEDFNPDRAAVIRDTIRRKLTEKGFRWTSASEEADLLVVYLVHTRDVELPAHPRRGHSFEEYMYDSQGRSTMQRHALDRDADETEIYHEGHLDVNLWDAASGQIYWHGYVERLIDDVNDRNAAELADEAFGKLFKSLPEAG